MLVSDLMHMSVKHSSNEQVGERAPMDHDFLFAVYHDKSFHMLVT